MVVLIVESGNGGRGYDSFVDVLSREWCRLAREKFVGIELSATLPRRVQFDVEGERFFVSVAEGSVESFELGDVADPDVTVRQPAEVAARVWAGVVREDEAMRATTIVMDEGGVPWVGPPTPADLLAHPEVQHLPAVPGASVLVAYRFPGGPFGTVSHWVRFEDGRPAADGFGTAIKADVRVQVPYSTIPLVRAGELSMLEALEQGAVDGDLGSLAVLAGIHESPEFQNAERALVRPTLGLATLGLLWASPAWTDALVQLGETTDAR